MKYNFNYETADEFEDLLDLLESKNLIKRDGVEIIPNSSLCNIIPVFLSIPETNDELLSIMSDEITIYNTWFNGTYYTVETTLDQLAHVTFDWSYYYRKAFTFICPHEHKKVRVIEYSPETLIQIVNANDRGAFVFEDYIYY